VAMSAPGAERGVGVWGGGGGGLFVLTHFKALHFTANHFVSFLFPSITNDIRIIRPLLIVYYLHTNISRLNSM